MMENILKGLKYKILKKIGDENPQGIEYDSRKIKKGDIFVALEGAVVDGHSYIDRAVENGAKIILVSKEIELKHPVTYILIEDLRRNLGFIASNFYKNPEKHLKIIGVTGTNGKTTTTYMLEKLLGENKTARIGTVEYKIADEIIEAPNTTPESLDIIKICKKAVDKGLEYLIMEVSSHALDMGRVEMLNFDAAIFTNLTAEHLDYHHTMEEYFQAKRKLFSKLKNPKNGVFNIDDEYGKRLYEEFGGVSFGIDEGDLQGKIKDITSNGEVIEVKFEENCIEKNLKILGRYNIYNLLGALGAAWLMVGNMRELLEKVEEIKTAPGRFELINEGQNFIVVVDFAHTAAALENILKSIDELKKGNVITIFGCGGDRDNTKRAPMGEVAERYSDITIVTSDNPRTENPIAIMEDIKKGIKKETTLFEEDRKKAIKLGIELAKENDVVLIAGKGHENYQIIGRTKYHMDDREIASEYLKKIKENN
jgi:UDP-N-acetylmuramoyl-L-alanyl-D-glutamate--2,6-diaminopimelate ligase